MCLSAPTPKIIKPPAPMLAPKSPAKAAEVTRKPSATVGKGKSKRRRGSSRDSLVIRNNQNPTSGSNNTNTGGVGVYS